MHPVQMLLEIILPRPPLIRTRAILPKAHVHHFGAALGLLVMNALLVAREVINCTKAFLARTAWFVAFEELTMPGLMFSLIGWTLANPRTGRMVTFDRDIEL